MMPFGAWLAGGALTATVRVRLAPGATVATLPSTSLTVKVAVIGVVTFCTVTL